MKRNEKFGTKEKRDAYKKKKEEEEEEKEWEAANPGKR
jgi:hypothetical protein